ncbi:MAG TPA: GxxExxY protein [Chthoniobacterales bacterium]|jgi:hypothetical protein|nr:GxxExxY protein [Chthoniobacterales bacterium]
MNKMIRMEEAPTHYDSCGQVIGAAMKVHSTLGSGFLKAAQSLVTMYEVQLVNYLTATAFDEGVLLNFGAERLEFEKKFRAPKKEEIFF